MDKKQLISKIISKKEFSNLPERDVELALSKFENRGYLDEEKIKLTRDLLRKVFSAFISKKLLLLKNKNPEWVLKKHLSTKERFLYYEELYKKLFNKIKGNFNIIDLGAGVNGFSYGYLKNLDYKVKYVGVEAIGQLVDLTNNYFSKNKLNARTIHLSLFELDKVKKAIKKEKGYKVVFLFKTLDSLEILKKDYSKKLLIGIAPFVDKIAVSFATKSLIKKKKFKINRKWIIDFIKSNFKIIDDFELGDEKYLIFEKK